MERARRSAAVSTVLTLSLALCACAAHEADSAPLAADVVVSWNERVLGIAEDEDGFLTLKGLRTATLMHLAMHDALNAIERRYATFRPVAATPDADPLTAANEAAYRVAIAAYPDRAADLEAEWRRWSTEATDRSLPAQELGRSAADAVLSERARDGWDAAAEYQWHPMGPGVYAEFNEHSGTPEGFIFGAGWAQARPFTLERPDQFRSPPPPAIDSDAYTRAFDEVKSVGAQGSTTRTADQTHLAMWWKEFVEKSHNRLARELVRADDPGLWEAARLFARLNMAIYDGYVSSFDAKFAYNHWRPYTAIRWASHDGNPDTAEDPSWTNLHDHTYAFPSYPSAHGTVCAAAMTVLGDAFGEERAFDMTIREVDAAGPMSDKILMDPATRSFSSFAEAATECALSRVYLGIHFRYDSEAGTALGRQVGATALETLGER